MKLVKCRDCSHRISTKAKSCPNCGRTKNNKNKTALQVLGAILFFFIIISASSSSIPTPDNQDDGLEQLSPPKHEQKAKLKITKEQFQVAALGASLLKKGMINPSSFKLLMAHVINSTNAVCYRYSAQNYYGGTIEQEAVLASDGKTFKTENDPEFSSLWESECLSRESIVNSTDVKGMIGYFMPDLVK